MVRGAAAPRVSLPEDLQRFARSGWLAASARPREGSECGEYKLTRRANQFRFSECVSSPKIKNISLLQKCEQWHIDRHPVPVRGAYHDRHERAAGSGGR